MAIKAKSKATKAIVAASSTHTGEDKANKAEASKSSAAIVKLIGAISTTRKTLEDKVAEAAARVVVHAVKFGDVTLAGRLISALDGSNGKGKTIVRANMMRAWFEQFGPFRFDTETKSFKLNKTKQAELKPRVKDAKSTAKFYGELNKQRAWEHKPEAKYVPYDFLAEAKKFVAAAKRQIEKKKDDPKSNVIGYDIFLKAMEEAEKARIKAEAEALEKVKAVA